MRPLSHHILSMIPATLALALVLLTAAPMDGELLSYTPNVAWLMTLVMVAHYPNAWPRGFAFFLGLLQDFLFATPLGAQALLTLLLAQLVSVQAQRQPTQLFRLHWIEVTGVLVLWHMLLWAVMHVVVHDGASLHGLVRAGIVNALWYPFFYGVVKRGLGTRD